MNTEGVMIILIILLLIFVVMWIESRFNSHTNIRKSIRKLMREHEDLQQKYHLLYGMVKPIEQYYKVEKLLKK